MNSAGYNQYKKARARLYRRPWFIALTWAASFASIVLLYISGKVISADIASFRSCSSNSSGLYNLSCGKAGLNFGDAVLLLLFLACMALSMSLFTGAVRMIRGRNA